MTDARDLDARTRADEVDVARARAGDTAAFAALVRRHQDRVFGFILRMLDARDEAMELTQDVFVKAMRETFRTVAVRKPDASRDRSAEIYLLGRTLR